MSAVLIKHIQSPAQLLDERGNPVADLPANINPGEAIEKACALDIPVGEVRRYSVTWGVELIVQGASVTPPTEEPEPEPEPEPNPEPPSDDQFQLSDDSGGPTQNMWSGHLRLRWANKMGDWTDVNGDSQGPAPFARAIVDGPGWIEFNVTELVKLDAKANRGMLISSTVNTGIPKFRGRHSTHTDKHPQLIVNGRPAASAPCTAFTAISTSTDFPSVQPTSVSVSRNSSGLIQFDIPDEPIVSATLRLYVWDKSSGTNAISIFRLNPPQFTRGGENEEPGLAREVGEDKLADHKDVIEVMDWSRYSDGTYHEILDGKILRGRFEPKTTRKDTRLSFTTKMHVCQADMADPLRPPDRVIEDVFCRMYVLLEDDWLSVTDANKGGIGWDLRYGWFNDAQGGYWQSTTGNGGAPGSGLKLFAPAGSLGGSQTDDRWEYQGHSVRMEFGKGRPGERYGHLLPVESYVYHLDQDGGYGSVYRLGSGVIERGQWFCIEQRVRQNSIVGPYDSNGNGQAVADGLLETWLNGTKISSIQNLRWRRHPDMGVQAAWLNWYYGGKFATERTIHYQVKDVVLAQQYIGPR